MTVYSFYIFDRHTECIYQRRWAQPPVPAAAAAAVNGDAGTSTPGSTSRPQSRSGAARAQSQSRSNAGTPTNANRPPSSNAPASAVNPATKASNDAKLLFGVVFSLRGMVRRLGGPDDDFISYTTGEYKLHYYETASNLKFCMLTDTRTGNLRAVLHQIWANLYVEFVVRNPLAPAEHPRGVGVNNELFEMGLDRFITQVFNPA